MIPAGLIDQNFEFFSHQGNLMLLTDGKLKSFDSMPAWLFNHLKETIDSSPEISKALDELRLIKPIDRIRKFVTCRFGACDNLPDSDEHGNFQDEFVPCEKRGLCVHEGILCAPIRAPYGYISTRELEVIQLMAQDLPNKMIADQLDISVCTVSTHIQHIQLKTGCHSKHGVVAWAAQQKLL